MKKEENKKNIPLGDKVTHSRTYNPDHLFPVKRAMARNEIGITHELPFTGYDIWNAYEISWLDMKGKPMVAMGEIIFPCMTQNIVESKSLKLYLNSFNQSSFESLEQVISIMEKDLSHCVEGDVSINFRLPPMFGNVKIAPPVGECIDDLDIDIKKYHIDPSFLLTGEETVEKSLYSNLLRTNCPVTQQPDWGSVIIEYSGREIDRKGLLTYIVSYREHTGFHENCVEHIFMDIMERCCPEKLSVYARFTRRGGIDINPFRSNCNVRYDNIRFARQ